MLFDLEDKENFEICSHKNCTLTGGVALTEYSKDRDEGSSGKSGDSPDSNWGGKPDCEEFDEPEPNVSFSVVGEGCSQGKTVLAVASGDGSMGEVGD